MKEKLMKFNFYNSNLNLNNKSILVTGGTGSFGKAFTKKILNLYKPKRLIIFSRDEHKQNEMANELKKYSNILRFFIGDVRDRERLIMATKGVDFIIHAAALKHVPSTEYNPFECIRTNIFGAENIIHAAINSNVKKTIALSTDKAANPINIYGASKLAADKIFISGNHLAANVKSRFSVVRYGNVIGSRGSIYWIIKNVIEKKLKKVPITDKRMTRFWITLDQGVEFVLSSLDLMSGGEIYVPKIPSMKITDFINSFCSDKKLEEIGIRPGEKLHETMITKEDSRYTYDCKDRYVIEPNIHQWDSERLKKNKIKGNKVQENFEYTSNLNKTWLTRKDLLSLEKFF
ncbi:MAG: UDP-N-acetylglucosamine 4,6-dehydratase (inverting) [Alphaproteobacteria bacterium MarineAlpha6_Bin6]|nr:UDP-N-acetylglucosamine 4,6-dehydratase (inverting) [Pelagibacteraceae bacterium]PPR30156.1 MAG: UDP-N-acetylglucosamine 4,6-dehydratase (inverting) [Alphaproteobacteria bacterium MarineAlpha6_Bin6]|tara:strand:+ start:4058 stop:5095 length:1038 start_codon:yes stop_codon:yes gene_type:complete